MDQPVQVPKEVNDFFEQYRLLFSKDTFSKLHREIETLRKEALEKKESYIKELSPFHKWECSLKLQNPFLRLKYPLVNRNTLDSHPLFIDGILEEIILRIEDPVDLLSFSCVCKPFRLVFEKLFCKLVQTFTFVEDERIESIIYRNEIDRINSIHPIFLLGWNEYQSLKPKKYSYMLKKGILSRYEFEYENTYIFSDLNYTLVLPPERPVKAISHFDKNRFGYNGGENVTATLIEHVVRSAVHVVPGSDILFSIIPGEVNTNVDVSVFLKELENGIVNHSFGINFHCFQDRQLHFAIPGMNSGPLLCRKSRFEYHRETASLQIVIYTNGMNFSISKKDFEEYHSLLGPKE